MPRKPEIGNVQLHPNRPLRKSDKNGYVLKFYCPLRCARIRKSCGTRDRREARRIQKECHERLINGRYIESGGAIKESDERHALPAAPIASDEKTWDAAFEHYRQHRKRRLRRKSSQDSDSRIDIAGRIFERRRQENRMPAGATLKECTTLEALEYLQNQLLDGAEARHASRSVNTVNSIINSVMTFVRFCHDHEWIAKIPPVKKIESNEVMRGRPITGEEFDRMLVAVPKVVGPLAAASWEFALRVLWESGFRIADLMDFSWDDPSRIHPVWPRRVSESPTIVIPSTQKNGRNEEIPLLPGLHALLMSIPETSRTGFVINPIPVEYTLRSQEEWFKPSKRDMQNLIAEYSNSAIARACGVSEQTVRKWLKSTSLARSAPVRQPDSEVDADTAAVLKSRAERTQHQRTISSRLTTERVSRIIASIGEEAGVVVRTFGGDEPRTKFASAHDLRRSVAERMINAGVSAETLMVIMRHRDFATTKKFYGARRSAQSAAAEVIQKLTPRDTKDPFVGGLVGGKEEAPQLSAEELRKVKALLKDL